MRSPRVCMPTPQCKSRLATGCFLFMWCGALVYKGTLRFWRRVWCCSLVLGWPSWEGELHSCPPPPPLLQGLRAGDRVGQRPGALGYTKSFLTWRSLVTPFIILPVFHLSLLLFLLRLWKVCLFHAVSFSSCFLWLRRWGHGVQRWVGFRVQRSRPSFLSTPTRRPFHSSLPDFMRSAPCTGTSSIHCVIPIDPISSLVP